jgi:hypothetical protein
MLGEVCPIHGLVVLGALLAVHELNEAGEAAWGLPKFEAVHSEVLEILPVR